MSNEKLTLIAGIFPCLEALQSGVSLEKIHLKKGIGGPNIEMIKTLALQQEVPIQQVPVQKLNRMTGVRHQGVIAIQSFIDYHNIEDVVMNVFEKGEQPLGILLDRVTDVRNFGAIARTAECMGCHFIVIPKRNSAQINDEALKTSAGALNHIPICRVDHLTEAVQLLQKSGVQVVGATEKAGRSIFEGEFEVPTVVVMGSEQDGISPSLLKTLDHSFKIPLRGQVNSLNVSVATAMFLTEICRQQSHTGG